MSILFPSFSIIFHRKRRRDTESIKEQAISAKKKKKKKNKQPTVNCFQKFDGNNIRLEAYFGNY